MLNINFLGLVFPDKAQQIVKVFSLFGWFFKILPKNVPIKRPKQFLKKTKNCKIQFFSLFGWFFLNFPPKTHCTLKMFLLSAQNNVYTILRLFVEGYVKSKSSLNLNQVWTLCIWLVSRPPKSGCFLENLL